MNDKSKDNCCVRVCASTPNIVLEMECSEVSRDPMYYVCHDHYEYAINNVVLPCCTIVRHYVLQEN